MKKRITAIMVSFILTMSFCPVVTAENEAVLSADLVNDPRVEKFYYDENGSAVVTFRGAPDDAGFINDKRIEKRYYDENGNMTIVFRDDIVMTARDLDDVEYSEAAKYKNPSDSDEEVIYTSTLGPITTEQLWAAATVKGAAIKYIWVQCAGFYPDGTAIDTVREEGSDPRFTYGGLVAKVKVPDSPFHSFEVGKGIANYVYEDPRFIRAVHYLTWNID